MSSIYNFKQKKKNCKYLMVPTSWNFSFKCYRWKHSFFCLSSRDTWLLSHVTFSGGKTNLHDNRAEQRRRVWSGAMFVRIFLFVDKTETSWQTLNSEEQLKLKHRLIALLWCQRQHWDQQLASAQVRPQCKRGKLRVKDRQRRLQWTSEAFWSN